MGKNRKNIELNDSDEFDEIDNLNDSDDIDENDEIEIDEIEIDELALKNIEGLDKINELEKMKNFKKSDFDSIDELIKLSLKVALLYNDKNKKKSKLKKLFDDSVTPKLDELLSNKTFKKLPLKKLSQLLEELQDLINH